jgi:hypothetical protein
MADIYCKYKDKYNIFSTITNSFIFEKGMTLEELGEYTKKWYGLYGLQNLQNNVLAVLQEHETTSVFYPTLKEVYAVSTEAEELVFNDVLYLYFEA